MSKHRTKRRRACRAATRTLAIATAVAALVMVLSAGQALAGPDERVLERQGRIDRQAPNGEADGQGKATEPSQAPPAQYPRRYQRPEPPMDTGPRLDADQQLPPAWHKHPATSEQDTAADAALQRVQARERFSIPNPTPAEMPAPVPPKPSRPAGWLVASLAVLVATLGLAGGLAVRAATRTRRRARLEHVT